MKNNAEKRGYEIGVGFNWLRSGTDSKFENGCSTKQTISSSQFCERAEVDFWKLDQSK
jgi:hypothetical protein